MSDDRTADHLAPTGTQIAALQILGPCAMAWTTNVFLAGASTTMFLFYIRSKPHLADPLWLKSYVWLVMMANLAACGISWHEIFMWLVSQARDYASLNGYIPADCVVYLPEGLCAALVQGFLAQRAARVFDQYYACLATKLILYSMIAIALSMSVTSTVFLFQVYDGIAPGAFNVNRSIPIWLWLSAATDLLITILLWIKLRSHMMGFNKNTDGVIVKLLRMALLTALPTTLMAISGATTSSVITARNSPLYAVAIVFISPLAPLYTMALLYTLKSRSSLRSALYSNQGVTGSGVKSVSIPTGTDNNSGSHEVISARQRNAGDRTWDDPDLPVTVTIEMEKFSEAAAAGKQSGHKSHNPRIPIFRQ